MVLTVFLWIFLWIISFAIWSYKDRGVGYYLLALFCPFIGFIVLLCLKKNRAHINSGTSIKSINIKKYKNYETRPNSLDTTKCNKDLKNSKTMENYYDVLGIPKFEDNQEIILSAYEEKTSYFEKNLTLLNNLDQPGISKFKSELTELNEAYLVISDKLLKIEYDKALCRSDFSPINKCISEKRNQAIDFVNSRLPKTKKNKKYKKIIAIVFCSLFIVGIIGRICNFFIHNFNPAPTELGTYSPDNTWQQYDFYNAFSIAVPKTMELRAENDGYTRLLTNNNLPINTDIVFQQKGLSNLSEESRSTYCRILIQYIKCIPGKVEKYNESPRLTQKDISDINQIIDAQMSGFDYVDQPEIKWVKISNFRAIEASYRRTGMGTTVSCKMYLLFNHDEMVKIITAYRDCDSSLWKNDIENVIKTFKWERLNRSKY